MAYSISLNRYAASLSVLHQPGPPTALDSGQGCIKLLLHRLQTPIAVVDSLGELTCRGLATALRSRRKVLPEQRMVDVAAAVEVDHGLQSNLSLDVFLVFCFRNLLREVVERGHVGLMMLGVVQLHDLAGDGGLERAVVIWNLSAAGNPSTEHSRVHTW
jgi:hypothetical protein